MMSAGVHAPKDPREKGKYLCFLHKTTLTASLRGDGSYTDEIDMDTNRLREKMRMMNGLTDETLLKAFDSTAGFRSVVAAIGISVESADVKTVRAEWIMYGKHSRYGSGTHLLAECPADGRETVIWLDNVGWSEDDDTSGQLRFFFESEAQTGTATVLLYMKPGVACTQPALDAPIDFAGEKYRALLGRSIYSRGNNARLKRVFARAANGKPVSLAFIGGSITQGAGARPINTECYAYKAWKNLETLLNVPVNFLKAGIGGTPSELGMVRFEKDVLKRGVPDIIVIEFAVNDNDDETQGRCYESLVRKALALPGEPAVVLLFSVFCDDWNLQDRLGPIGRHYQLPMVSVLDAVVPQFTHDTVIAKRQYFYDSYHPTNDGHRVMADCLTHLFAETMRAPADAPAAMPEQSFSGRTFETVHLLDKAHPLPGAKISCGGFAAIDQNLQATEPDDQYRAVPQFPDNWMHAPNTENTPFTLTLCCKSLFLLEKDSSEDAFGTAEVWVDGALCRSVNPHKVGWIHCGALLLFEADAAAPHKIEVRMAEAEQNRAFTILGFGVC